jgi:putative transcriptional regulator
MDIDMELRVEQGTLLAAGPDMLDPNFMHSVVLICQHTSAGAYGLVINRPSGHSTRAVLSEHHLFKDIDFPMFLGGPVGLGGLQVLHRVPEEIPGGVPLLQNLWIGGDLDALGQFLAKHTDTAEDSVRLLLGYSGWGAGQLESELSSGSWLPAPGLPERVFTRDHALLWRSVMRSLGRDAQGFEVQPPDPRWN